MQFSPKKFTSLPLVLLWISFFACSPAHSQSLRDVDDMQRKEADAANSFCESLKNITPIYKKDPKFSQEMVVSNGQAYLLNGFADTKTSCSKGIMLGQQSSRKDSCSTNQLSGAYDQVVRIEEWQLEEGGAKLIRYKQRNVRNCVTGVYSYKGQVQKEVFRRINRSKNSDEAQIGNSPYSW